MKGNEVRQKFLDYFNQHGHQIVRSSSLVPQDDPTLLFVNAGMVQFKRSFLGEEKRDYNRATTSQKCVRAGGKHNDLENVGYTARHHTFFEMLGNFSFGDYFKEKAIDYAWDLLTNGYGLPADQLWVSIYLDDDEAHDLWHQNIGVPVERIARFGEEDNFWAMGDTGPCGPCSEVHIDRGAELACGPDCKLGCDCDRWLEIWNLVFMQFNRDEEGVLTPLPKPSIDTGLGLERMASILQGVDTNYDIDLIVPIIRAAEELAERSVDESREVEVAMKVIADHSRAAAFLIGDGIMPSNEGRGYVLRRIMRRAIRYGRNIGLNKLFLHQTASVVFDIMKPSYPDLADSEAFITNVIQNEELRFSETLDHGLKILNEELEELRAQDVQTVPGELIFKLSAPFGFPVDIVRDVVRDEGMALDMDGFDQAMDEQRERSKSIVTFTSVADAYKNLSSQGVTTEFTGYAGLSGDAEALVLVRDGQEVEEIGAADEVEIVTAQTPFYAESGGQVGDVGTISADDFEMQVTDTIKDPSGLIVHRGKVISGQLAKGGSVHLEVSREARSATAANHTATHILHHALQKVLGDHIKQAGSAVAPDRMRFDFTHFEQVDHDTIIELERIVNTRVRENDDVHIEEMDSEEAFKTGAKALFEEKYGDKVRVISLGEYSKELCGGTHTTRTGNIGLFRITSEASVASGVRRIEAVTGAAAVDHSLQESQIVHDTARLLRDKPAGLVVRVEKILGRQKRLERVVDQLKAKLATAAADTGAAVIQKVDGAKVLVKKVSVDSPAALRELADRFKDKLKSGVIVLGSSGEDKALLIAVVTKDHAERFHAGNIVKALAPIVGGGGGGRPDMAQAGGTKPEKIDEALEKAIEVIKGSNE